MTNPLPTFVVGAGRGGIEIMKTLADVVERDGHSKYFDYIAIDTDTDSFTGLPDDATEIELEAPKAFVAEDRRKYTYLSDDMEIGVKGAERQRAVGRYKLDSRGTPDFSDHYDLIWKSARQHLRGLDQSYESNRDSYNLILLHSLGGGTGSGTFPLLGTMLSQMGEVIEERFSIDVYLAGVGIAPQIPQDPEIVQPMGQSIYYPNAYTSFLDLSKMIKAGDEPRDIPLYSRSYGRGGQRTDIDESVEAAFTGNSLPIDRSPFSNYWLVGVEEDLIMGGSGFSDIENYGEMVDRQVAESIHALSLMDESVENWSTDVNGLATLGGMGQSEIRVPYNEIHDYCELKAARGEKQTRLETDIPDEIETLEDEISQMEAVKKDPTLATIDRKSVDDVEKFVRGELEQSLQVGSAFVDGNSAEDIEAVLSKIGEEYGPEVMLLAVEKLDEMFQHPAAVPAVETHWEEVIDQQWKGWNMNSKSEFGGSDVRSYKGKEAALERYFDKTISEYEKEVEAREPGTLDKIPPVMSVFESTREEYQRWLDNLRNSQQELVEADSRYHRVQAMVDAADEYHREAKQRLDTKIAERQESITELEEEKRKLTREIERKGREIEKLADQITDRERVGQRLSILPIKEDSLEDLTLNRLENELTSLDRFIDEFISEEDLEIGIEKIQSNARAWEDPTNQMNFDGLTQKPNRQQMWIMYHEENEEYAEKHISPASGATTHKAGQGLFGYSDDPYSIQFVSFQNDGPVEALRLFQRYEKMRDSGMLDSMAGKFGDYHASHAYPEWYGRETQKKRNISKRQTTPRPPELDADRIVKDDFESEGEKKNYIKTHGIDLYLWHGEMWTHFDPREETSDMFKGWEQTLDGLTFKQLQQATPDEELKARWLASGADWAEILEAYTRNLEDKEKLEISFEEED